VQKQDQIKGPSIGCSEIFGNLKGVKQGRSGSDKRIGKVRNSGSFERIQKNAQVHLRMSKRYKVYLNDV
jgi:hypothetical protein